MNFSKPKISIDKLNLDIPDLDKVYILQIQKNLFQKKRNFQKKPVKRKKTQSLKNDIYQGELITEEILKKFENDNKINLLSFRDTIGQSILHVAVDALSFSAVDSLIKMNYAQELIDVCDDSNMTPMHIADINFDLHIYDLLIHLGPNKNIKDKE